MKKEFSKKYLNENEDDQFLIDLINMCEDNEFLGLEYITDNTKFDESLDALTYSTIFKDMDTNEYWELSYSFDIRYEDGLIEDSLKVKKVKPVEKTQTIIVYEEI